MPRLANLALQADLCYNGGRNIVVPGSAVNTPGRIHLYRRCTMDTIPSTSGIYKITCTANKKIYIGSAVNLRDRKGSHWSKLCRNEHANPKLQNAWNKYGEQAFTFEVVEYVLPMSLTAREQYWFHKLNPFDRKGFNIYREAGSPLGTKQTPEQIEKMRQTKLGRKQSPEHIKNRTQQAIGRKASPEWVENNRQSHLGHKPTSETREKMSQVHLGHIRNLGYKHTIEAREHMRQAQFGRKHSPETIEKMRQAKLGKKRDEKGRFTCPD